MDYKLYSDTPNKFICNVQIKGATLKNSKARMIIESNSLNYIFNGSIDKNGKCEIVIPKTKNFLSENVSGIMKLEIIADDLFFEPWNSKFTINESKKVKVSIQENIQTAPETEVTVVLKEQKEPEVFYTKDELRELLKRK